MGFQNIRHSLWFDVRFRITSLFSMEWWIQSCKLQPCSYLHWKFRVSEQIPSFWGLSSNFAWDSQGLLHLKFQNKSFRNGVEKYVDKTLVWTAENWPSSSLKKYLKFNDPVSLPNEFISFKAGLAYFLHSFKKSDVFRS